MSHLAALTLFWLSLACAVFASLAVVWASRPSRTPSGETHSVSDLIWAIVPTVALFAVLVLTWHAIQS
jgi:hypothetical protein